MDTETQTTRKHHPDSKLKTLPQERQDQIARYAQDNSLAKTVEWLDGQGIQISDSSLSRFLSWYRLRQQMERNQNTFTELLSDLKRNDPDLTADRLQQIGHVFFAGKALEHQDQRGWYLIQQIAVRKAQVELEIQKHKDELQAHKDALERELKAAQATGGITPETVKRIEQELGLC
jgi:hypothetical protein